MQYAIETIELMKEATDPFTVTKHKAVFDSQMKLVNKYLPELKATEISGDSDNPVLVTQIVYPEA